MIWAFRKRRANFESVPRLIKTIVVRQYVYLPFLRGSARRHCAQSGRHEAYIIRVRVELSLSALDRAATSAIRILSLYKAYIRAKRRN